MKGSIGWFLLVGVLLLGACSGTAQPAPEDSIVESAAAEPTATAVSPAPATATPEPAAEGAATEPALPAEPTVAATEAPPPPEPTEVPTEVLEPTPRTELKATNPREVNLASGDLQFVEFFAYW